MRFMIMPMAAMALAGIGAPALAQNSSPYNNGYPNGDPRGNYSQQDGDHRDGDRRDGDRRDEEQRRAAWQNANGGRGELHRDQRDIAQQQREFQDAQRYGTRNDIRNERRDVQDAKHEYQRDAADWRRGNRYNWNRPDPRYNGYYANNYYRSGGNYQARVLGPNDRIYRGQDNRYYCRRNDGTTGLIIGALGGGVLGNVIAPGGSKAVGTIGGGVLGALLGSSIDRNSNNNRITCR